MKGLTEMGIKRLNERGYNIASESKTKMLILKNGEPVIEIHFKLENQKILDLDEASGTIKVLEMNETKEFEKMIGVYVTGEGLVLDYQDKSEKPRTVRESKNGWIV